MKSPQAKQDLLNTVTELFKARAASPDDEAPTISELAAFFYGKTDDASIARKVALHDDARDEIALYARAEHDAVQYQPCKEVAQIPAQAWEMIHRWEENEFAKPKLQTNILNQESLRQLAKVLVEREDLKSQTISHRHITVVIVNTAGEIRGFEKFEKSETTTGITLKHAEQSARFADRELHAVSNQGGKEYEIASYKIERDRVRLGKLAHRADYFIIEDE
jgi:hypothetical protein